MRRSAADPQAFEHVVRRHRAALYGYLLRRAPQAASDLLSDTWVVAFTRRADFDPSIASVRTWLFGIARTVLLGHWRDAQRVPLVGGTDNDDDDWSAIDRRLDAAAARPALRAALARLAAVDREVLLLVAWEQLTPAEAARIVGVPQGTARSRLHRARHQLRDSLAASTSHDMQTATQTPAVGRKGAPT